MDLPARHVPVKRLELIPLQLVTNVAMIWALILLFMQQRHRCSHRLGRYLLWRRHL
jgi:hypothetical protein